jgi:WD40 repeat protein
MQGGPSFSASKFTEYPNVTPTPRRKPIRLELITEGELPDEFARGRIDVLKFTPDGKSLVGGLSHDRVAIWETATGKLKNTAVPQQSAQRATTLDDWHMYSIAISTDGKLLATPTHRRAIQLWLIRDLKPCKSIETENYPPISVAFSPDSEWLVAGLDKDGTIGHDQEYVLDIAFSPDGLLLASGSASGQIHLWNVETGHLRGKLRHEKHVRTLMFSPDGEVLASGDNDNSLKIWSVTDGKELKSKQFDHGVRTVAFSPDGKIIAMATEGSKKVLIWQVRA